MLKKWDPSEYLDSEEAIIAYLDEAAKTGDPALIEKAIGNAAKARGMTQIAKEAGVGRESLLKEKALSSSARRTCLR